MPRPLLFQASAIQGPPALSTPHKQCLDAPALGRIAPVEFTDPPPMVPRAAEPCFQDEDTSIPEASPSQAYLFLVKMEAIEALALLLINGVLLLLARLLSGLPLAQLYGALWFFLLPLHFAVSWCFVMLPLVLVGQSIAMFRCGFVLDSMQPERRMTFAIFHLLSSCCLPLSFLCVLLTPEHRTLAELLTGQELLAKTSRTGS